MPPRRPPAGADPAGRRDPGCGRHANEDEAPRGPVLRRTDEARAAAPPPSGIRSSSRCGSRAAYGTGARRSRAITPCRPSGPVRGRRDGEDGRDAAGQDLGRHPADDGRAAARGTVREVGVHHGRTRRRRRCRGLGGGRRRTPNGTGHSRRSRRAAPPAVGADRCRAGGDPAPPGGRRFLRRLRGGACADRVPCGHTAATGRPRRIEDARWQRQPHSAQVGRSTRVTTAAVHIQPGPWEISST